MGTIRLQRTSALWGLLQTATWSQLHAQGQHQSPYEGSELELQYSSPSLGFLTTLTLLWCSGHLSCIQLVVN